MKRIDIDKEIKAKSIDKAAEKFAKVLTASRVAAALAAVNAAGHTVTSPESPKA